MIIDYDQIPQLIEKNLEVRISQENLNSAQIQKKSLLTSFVPEVALYAQGEDSRLNKVGKELTAGAIASVNVFNGFRDVEQVKINSLAYETSKLEFKKSYNEQVFEAKKAYFEALRIQENLKILTEHESVNRSNRALILKKVNSGLSPKSEELVFKKIDLGLKEQKIKEENNLKIILSDLRKLLAIEKEEKIEVKGNFDISKFTYTPSSKYLDLALAESSEEQIRAEKKQVKLWRMPRVNFYAERSFSDHVNGEYLEEGDEKQVFGLRLTLPLLSEGNASSIEEQTKETQHQASLLRKKNQLLEQARTRDKMELVLNNLKSMIEISKEKVMLSKEIMDKTYSEFKLGLKEEALSLNEAAEEYLEARKDLVEHQIEYILKVEESKIQDY